jgi:hypothetical protein
VESINRFVFLWCLWRRADMYMSIYMDFYGHPRCYYNILNYCSSLLYLKCNTTFLR